MAHDENSQQAALRSLEQNPHHYDAIMDAYGSGCNEQDIRDAMATGLETHIARCQVARSQERKRWGAESGENRGYQGMYEGYKAALGQGGVDGVIRQIPECLK